MDTQTDNSINLTRQLGLYALTVLLETPVILLRTFLVWVVAAILLLITGHSTFHAGTWALIGLWPTIWSISALIPTWGTGRNSQTAAGCVLAVVVMEIATGHLVFAIMTIVFSLSVLVSPWATGWWWRNRVGGREPSTRENEAFKDAMRILEQQTPGQLPKPRQWFVLDVPDIEAAVCGHTLMLSHALLESPHLTACLAHELGHLATLDGPMNAALNRLAIHPLREPHPDQERHHHQTMLLLTDDPVTQTIIAVGVFALITRMLLKCCRGGLGLWLLRPLWGAEWRTNEYQADQYAATLGVGQELAESLETNGLIYDRPVPFNWLTAHTHPPTELRIDRLRTRDIENYTGGLDEPVSAQSGPRLETAV